MFTSIRKSNFAIANRNTWTDEAIRQYPSHEVAATRMDTELPLGPEHGYGDQEDLMAWVSAMQQIIQCVPEHSATYLAATIPPSDPLLILTPSRNHLRQQ